MLFLNIVFNWFSKFECSYLSRFYGRKVYFWNCACVVDLVVTPFRQTSYTNVRVFGILLKIRRKYYFLCIVDLFCFMVILFIIIELLSEASASHSEKFPFSTYFDFICWTCHSIFSPLKIVVILYLVLITMFVFYHFKSCFLFLISFSVIDRSNPSCRVDVWIVLFVMFWGETCRVPKCFE